MKEAIETVAKAIYAVDQCRGFSWEEQHESVREEYRDYARAAVAAMPKSKRPQLWLAKDIIAAVVKDNPDASPVEIKRQSALYGRNLPRPTAYNTIGLMVRQGKIIKRGDGYYAAGKDAA